MLQKARTKPKELVVLTSLNTRTILDKEAQHYYQNLQRGFAGELQLDNLTSNLACDCMIFNDLLLEVNQTTFQIDTLILTHNQINLLEVKNYGGDYICEKDKFIKQPHFEITNPLHQATRATSLLQQLLQQHGMKIPIRSAVLFINQTFTLYQAPPNESIILPNQIETYMNRLGENHTKLTRNDKRIADFLQSQHIQHSPFTKLPKFTYSQLRKGIICPKCHNLDNERVGRTIICESCSYKQPTKKAILRGVNEFKYLFPDEKVTTNMIHDWCKIIPKRTVARVLKQHYRMVGVHQWAYYI